MLLLLLLLEHLQPWHQKKVPSLANLLLLLLLLLPPVAAAMHGLILHLEARKPACPGEGGCSRGRWLPLSHSGCRQSYNLRSCSSR